MNPAETLDWLKRHGLVLALLLAIGAALYWQPGSGSQASEHARSSTTQSADQSETEQDRLREALNSTLALQEAFRESQAQEASQIQEHLEALERELSPDERAARLCALGNLYQQEQQDYATAAGYYELQIAEHPDWPGTTTAYHQLMNCYKRMNDQQSLRLLYREMARVFPEGSAEHAFATAALDLGPQ